ncbi:MAG TPA: FeoB-associated Cys-rich membrane protein [Candidatus Gallimonas gallistercoris]|uniref:FeoB-associated Cys-rich membrane protein n=1 Tax=Candidatus Gallimonas gallistercoris TaxID=2838602 RepID=A0A9D2KGY5_9FIRM|nr:FeoB-associated Cys-rich membrane protein [Candidatus Gallimonas gallistercoris]
MQHLFSGAQLHAASLTGTGLIVTLVLAAIILAAAVFAVISIVKRRHKKGGCHGCGGSCSSCGMSCPVKRESRSEDTDGKNK